MNRLTSRSVYSGTDPSVPIIGSPLARPISKEESRWPFSSSASPWIIGEWNGGVPLPLWSLSCRHRRGRWCVPSFFILLPSLVFSVKSEHGMTFGWSKNLAVSWNYMFTDCVQIVRGLNRALFNQSPDPTAPVPVTVKSFDELVKNCTGICLRTMRV